MPHVTSGGKQVNLVEKASSHSRDPGVRRQHGVRRQDEERRLRAGDRRHPLFQRHARRGNKVAKDIGVKFIYTGPVDTNPVDQLQIVQNCSTRG